MKISVSANVPSLNNSFWISDAEVELVPDVEISPEQRSMTIAELEGIMKNLEGKKHSCRVIKKFDYRQPLMFQSEIWHDAELEDLNRKLREICRL